MPTPKKGARLGGSPAHQRLILANLATSLFEHGRITTTEAKARVLRPYAEKLITKAKRGDLHNRRQVLSVIRDKTVVHVLFTDIGPRYADRPGGYTRITKIGPRKGDNAPMAVIELVTEEYAPRVRTAGAAGGTTSAAKGSTVQGRHAAAPTAGDDPAASETTTDEAASVTDESAAEDATTVDSATIDPDVPAPGATLDSAAVQDSQEPLETTGGEDASAEDDDAPPEAVPAEETVGGEPVPPADTTNGAK